MYCKNEKGLGDIQIIMNRLIDGIKKYGLSRTISGGLKHIRFRYLQKKYGFDSWHLRPIEFRDYALLVIKMATELFSEEICSENGLTVELGCGMGEIISKVPCARKIGVDISESVIECAKKLHTDIEFNVGSFNDITDKNIELFIMVNFLHDISGDVIKEAINGLISRNCIKIFIIDRLENIDNSNYSYAHNGEEIFGENYELRHRSNPISAEGGAQRYIECWEKKS